MPKRSTLNIAVNPKLHEKLRLLAAFEKKKLRVLTDRLIPIVDKWLKPHMAKNGGKR